MVYLADSLVDLLARHIATFGTNGESQWLFVSRGTYLRKRLRQEGEVAADLRRQ